MALVRRTAYIGWTERIHAAAAALLPVLEQRQQQENAPQVLLRAASVADTRAETLLRPASATTETEPQQLLRASIAKKNEGP